MNPSPVIMAEKQLDVYLDIYVVSIIDEQRMINDGSRSSAHALMPVTIRAGRYQATHQLS